MRKSLLLIFCLLLAGCSDADWDHTLNYAGLRGSVEEPEVEAQKSAPASVTTPSAETAAAQSSAGTDFCRSVAMQDASDNGFDQATQQRVYARSYAQCAALNAR
jgi:hypothetical protein